VSETETPLTPEIVRDYIDSQGTHCPFCNSSEIEAGKIEADAASAWSPVTCNDCGKEWRDVFFLGAVDIVDENGRYVDTIVPASEAPDGSGNSNAAEPCPT
jgi:hypothetical protein